MSIAGKYVLSSQEGFQEFITKLSLPIPKPDDVKQMKLTFIFTVNGNKITKTTCFDGDEGKSRKTEFVIGESFEEKMGPDTFKNIAKLEGNVLTIESQGNDGSVWNKIHTFSGSGLELLHKSTKAGEAKQLFKRV